MKWPDDILKRKLILVTGKGGVGKTTLVVSLAQMLKEEGKKVVVVEASRTPQLPKFAEGLEIECENLDVAQCFKDYLIEKLHQPKLYETVFSRDSVKTFLETIPGLGEVMLLGWMYFAVHESNKKKCDVVLFDAPSSGHFLTLLTTPKAIIETSIGGPLVHEVEKIQEFLTNGSSSIIYLSAPEDLIMSETLEFLPKINKLTKIPIEMLIINRVPDGKLPLDLSDKLKVWISNELSRNFKAIQFLVSNLPEIFLQKAYTLPLIQGLQPPLKKDRLKSLISSLKKLVKE